MVDTDDLLPDPRPNKLSPFTAVLAKQTQHLGKRRAQLLAMSPGLMSGVWAEFPPLLLASAGYPPALNNLHKRGAFGEDSRIGNITPRLSFQFHTFGS